MEKERTKQLRAYEAPFTKRTIVEPESDFCVVTSSQEKATINKKDAEIQVKEYNEITNNIEFN